MVILDAGYTACIVQAALQREEESTRMTANDLSFREKTQIFNRRHVLDMK
ncbi:hypothetical protein [Undibacterium sp. TC9W]